MKSGSAKITILLISITVILIVGASSFAIAFWGSDPVTSIEGGNATTIIYPEASDMTYRYQIFIANVMEGGNEVEKEIYFKYNDTTNKYHAYKRYNDSEYPLTTNVNDITSVTLCVYEGALGEYEQLKVPSTISIEGRDTSVTVKYIDLRMPESTKDIITSVWIPVTVEQIRGNSFSGCNNLVKVIYETRKTPSIGENCFIGKTIVEQIA